MATPASSAPAPMPLASLAPVVNDHAARAAILAAAGAFWPDGTVPDNVAAPPPGPYTLVATDVAFAAALSAPAPPLLRRIRFPPGLLAPTHQHGPLGLPDATSTFVDCGGHTWEAAEATIYAATPGDTLLALYNCTVLAPAAPVPSTGQLALWHSRCLFDCEVRAT
jgi:hypothetical protein